MYFLSFLRNSFKMSFTTIDYSLLKYIPLVMIISFRINEQFLQFITIQQPIRKDKIIYINQVRIRKSRFIFGMYIKNYYMRVI